LTITLLSGILGNGSNGNKSIILGRNRYFMYRNVLLTDKEIALIKSIISETLSEKLVPEAKNLTIILNRLREIRPTIKYSQTVN